LSTGYVTSQSVTSFSPFTFGSLDGSNALPVELISFTANYIKPKVHLEWTTASEINNDYFTIEKSRDGNNFEAIKKVEGAGTTSDISNYFEVDISPYIGVSYYRIKQTDYDGQYDYSELVAVNVPDNFSDEQITIYPNPSRAGNFSIDINSIESNTISVSIYSLSGNKIYSQNYDNSGQLGGKITIVNHIPLSTGQYLVKIRGDSFVTVRKISVY